MKKWSKYSSFIFYFLWNIGRGKWLTQRILKYTTNKLYLYAFNLLEIFSHRLFIFHFKFTTTDRINPMYFTEVFMIDERSSCRRPYITNKWCFTQYLQKKTTLKWTSIRFLSNGFIEPFSFLFYSSRCSIRSYIIYRSLKPQTASKYRC